MLAESVSAVNCAVALHRRPALKAGQIASIIGEWRTGVLSALNTLGKRGVVFESRIGRDRLFGVDTTSSYHPIAHSLALVDLPVGDALAIAGAGAALVHGPCLDSRSPRPTPIEITLVGGDPTCFANEMSPFENRLERQIVVADTVGVDIKGTAQLTGGLLLSGKQWGTKKASNVQTRPGISPRVRFAIYFKDGFRCVYCGRTATDGALLTLDHIVPFSESKDDSEGNLQTACSDCQSARGTTPLL